jgi:hypothetical protein
LSVSEDLLFLPVRFWISQDRDESQLNSTIELTRHRSYSHESACLTDAMT